MDSTPHVRYVKNGLHWMPERKDKQGNWVTFKEDWVGKFEEIMELATVIASLTKSRPFYNNTKEMFFVNEMQVNAFLGGFQAYFSKTTKEFEIFLENEKAP